MKNYLKFLASAAVFLVLFPQVSKAINPLYQLSARNVHIGTGSRSNNELTFDIAIYHSNSQQSGPFEFASGQYILLFNPAIANGGTLSYSIVSGSSEFTNPDAVPRFPSISGNQLRLFINPYIPPGNGPIVSDVFPGTRIVTVLLTTTAPSFAQVPLNLQWRDSTFGDPFTEVSGYVDGHLASLNSEGTLVIDDPNPPLPVELSSFTSDVNANNIKLRWTTASETNNSGFEIQRMALGNKTDLQWSIAGFVSGSGNSISSRSYEFNEKLNSGKYRYRLKQVDYNGNNEYFNLNNEVNVGTPDAYSISQNYPNPFNPETRIDFNIARSGNVNIVLYDAGGREVAVLLNEIKDAGYYGMTFNASNLSSGTYFYTITSGKYIETKRMVLLK